MAIKIKLIVAAGVLLAGGLLACYVQGLHADNERLNADNARLLTVNAANVAAIQALESQRARDNRLLQQWAGEQERIKQLQLQISRQIQRELSNDEEFKNWSHGLVPGGAIGLLQPANSD